MFAATKHDQKKLSINKQNQTLPNGSTNWDQEHSGTRLQARRAFFTSSPSPVRERRAGRACSTVSAGLLVIKKIKTLRAAFAKQLQLPSKMTCAADRCSPSLLLECAYIFGG